MFCAICSKNQMAVFFILRRFILKKLYYYDIIILLLTDFIILNTDFVIAGVAFFENEVRKMYILGQIISVIAMVAIILSFQCKSNKKLVVVMGTGALLFAVSYLILGQPSAAMFNIISVICSVACLKDNLKTKFVFGIIFALFIVAIIFTFNGWWSIMLMLAQVAGAYSLMFKSGTYIRNMRFFFVSPIWLVNNTIMCFSIGGIVCEIISMASIIVSFIRYRKTGFDT